MKINSLGQGVSGKSLNVTAQERINLFLDIQPGDGDKAKVTAHGTPGLTAFKAATSFGSDIILGIYYWEDQDRLAVGTTDNLYLVNPSSGAITATNAWPSVLGAGNTLTFASNGDELMIAPYADYPLVCDSTGVPSEAKLDGVTSFAVASVAFIAGRFVLAEYVGALAVLNGGRAYYSALYDGTSWASLDFFTAENAPDGLGAVFTWRDTLIMFGYSSIEFWTPTVDPDLPFQRVAGTSGEVGIVSETTIALCGQDLMFLGKSTQGRRSLYRISGYSAEPVSPPDMDYIWSSLTSSSLTKPYVAAFSASFFGHDFYHLTFAADGRTFVYDNTSGVWSELKTGSGVHKALYGATDHSQLPPKTIVSDPDSDALYTWDPTTYTDNGTAITRTLVLPHLFDAESLNQVIVSRLRLDMEGGVGNAAEPNPTIALYISRDGGHTYGSALSQAIGAASAYTTRAEWRRLGIARDWTFKLVIDDPVKVAMIGAYAEVEAADK